MNKCYTGSLKPEARILIVSCSHESCVALLLRGGKSVDTVFASLAGEESLAEEILRSSFYDEARYIWSPDEGLAKRLSELLGLFLLCLEGRRDEITDTLRAYGLFAENLSRELLEVFSSGIQYKGGLH